MKAKICDERSAVINLGGKQYELLLTLRATKEISRRYGGLENLGETLSNSESFEKILDKVVDLIVLLANQPILIHNLANKDNPKDLLTEEEVELLASPVDFETYSDAIMLCLHKGTVRNVVSEKSESKNGTAE